MSLVLYGYWRSSASYRVRIALNLKQLDYAYHPVHLVNDGGQQHSEAYSKLNPSHLVPTLIDEERDLALSQSLAIIEYLDEAYSSGCDLMPKDAADKATVRSIAQDLACDIQPLANLRVLQYLSSQSESFEQKQWCQHWISKGFQALEQKLKHRAGKYCYGYQLSLADICLVPQVYNALRFELDMTAFPTINRIYQACNSLEAFIQAKPENQPDAD